MRCAQCGHLNEVGSAFCQQCGTRLGESKGIACSRCGTVNSSAVRFCIECGQAVAQAAPQAPNPLPTALLPSAVPAALVMIEKDGTDGREFPLAKVQMDIGSREGDVILEEDPYLSPRHVRIRRKDGTFVLNDLNSTNGVYLRLRQGTELRDGDMILLGQQVLRFETMGQHIPLGPATSNGVFLFGTPETPSVGRLIQYTTEGIGRNVHYLYKDQTILGREEGDVVFTDDPFLSRRHAIISYDRKRQSCSLADLDSSNGTAVRLRNPYTLKHGDVFRVGGHLFRFDHLAETSAAS